MKRIGIKSVDFKFDNKNGFEDLKNQFLYFDEIQLDYEFNKSLLEINYTIHNSDREILRNIADLEYLYEKDVIKEFDISFVRNRINAANEDDSLDKDTEKYVLEMMKLLSRRDEFISFDIDTRVKSDVMPEYMKDALSGFDGSDIYKAEVANDMVRMVGYPSWVAEFAKKPTYMLPYYSSPLLDFADEENMYSPIVPAIPSTEISKDYSNVAGVIFSRMPSIDIGTSWERIVDFKEDEDSRRKFLAFKRWASKISSSNISLKEMSEELEHLLYEYEHAIKLHKLKYNYSSIEIATTTTLEIISNLAKLQLGKVAKTLFDIKRRRVDYLFGEIDTPGKEVAYIHKIRGEFKS